MHGLKGLRLITVVIHDQAPKPWCPFFMERGRYGVLKLDNINSAKEQFDLGPVVQSIV